MEDGSNMSSQYDVGIVGSGPTGLALAALLAGQDVRVGLFDRGYDAVATPRATHIDDEVMRIFQALRVAYDLEPELYFTPGYEMFDSAWNCFYEIRVAEGVGEQGWRSDYMFHQPSFERRLREALDASDLVDLHQGVAVEALSQSDSGVEVQARDVEGGEARCFRAAFVVGCDGAHSTVRRVMESDVEDLEGAQRWLVTDVLLHEGVDDVPERLFSYCAEPPELSVTYVTTGTRRRRVEFKMPAGADAEEFEQPDKVWALLGPYIGRDKGQLERVDVYTFNSRLAVTWRSGRLFLAGDAAHEMPPKAGQGLCSGFRDAMNLAWKLAYVVKGQAAESLLESYETERRPHALHWIQVSDFMARSIDAMSQGATPPPPPATEDEAAPGPPRPPPWARAPRRPRPWRRALRAASQG